MTRYLLSWFGNGNSATLPSSKMGRPRHLRIANRHDDCNERGTGKTVARSWRTSGPPELVFKSANVESRLASDASAMLSGDGLLMKNFALQSAPACRRSLVMASLSHFRLSHVSLADLADHFHQL